MDELIIDEKKYISSKQAAKVTGYAKDYVGQLCREGRVQAQLVGRSWYVLESSILDHRFGTEVAEREAVPAPRTVPETIFGWKAPRYEAAEDEPLPVVEKAQEVKIEPQEVIEDDLIVSESHVDVAAAKDEDQATSIAFDIAPRSTDVDDGKGEDDDVLTTTEPEIREPIDTIETQEAVDVPEEHVISANPIRTRIRRHRVKRIVYGALRTALVTIATASAVYAALNSGYFDTHLTSVNRVNSLIGISVYKK